MSELYLCELNKLKSIKSVCLENASLTYLGFPDSSLGKESTCNAGDPASVPGSGRSAGERIDYSLQYSWASLVAQMVENPPAMWETWVRSLEKGTTTHSSILAWRIPWIVHGVLDLEK